ncbi:hypothetical protein Pelo_9195 [Pelomyxa schiedti]|nr:hypothetical protein Pelo_9195 [Pelomyxa schiedti]
MASVTQTPNRQDQQHAPSAKEQPPTMWCHKCSRTFKPLSPDSACPYCWDGFVEVATPEQLEAYSKAAQQREQQQQRSSVPQASRQNQQTLPRNNENATAAAPQQLPPPTNEAWSESNAGRWMPHLMTALRRYEEIQQTPSPSAAPAAAPTPTPTTAPTPTPTPTPTPETPTTPSPSSQQGAARQPILVQFVTINFSDTEGTPSSGESSAQERRPPVTLVFVSQLGEMPADSVPGSAQPPSGFSSGDYIASNDEFQALLNHLFRQSQPQGAPPATEKAIEELTSIRATKEQIEQHEECSICKDEYEEGAELLQLHCKHSYHPDCIKHWLKMHNTCPVCRSPVSANKREDEEVQPAAPAASN